MLVQHLPMPEEVPVISITRREGLLLDEDAMG